MKNFANPAMLINTEIMLRKEFFNFIIIFKQMISMILMRKLYIKEQSNKYKNVWIYSLGNLIIKQWIEIKNGKIS